MEQANQRIKELAKERYLTGKQVYDWQTRRLRAQYANEIVARAVLVRAQRIARKNGGKLKLTYLERRLLARAKIVL